jgi:hypothetical protein
VTAKRALGRPSAAATLTNLNRWRLYRFDQMPSDEIQMSRAQINSALRRGVRRKVRVRTAESHDLRAGRLVLRQFSARAGLIAHAIMRVAIRSAGLR